MSCSLRYSIFGLAACIVKGRGKPFIVLKFHVPATDTCEGAMEVSEPQPETDNDKTSVAIDVAINRRMRSPGEEQERPCSIRAVDATSLWALHHCGLGCAAYGMTVFRLRELLSICLRSDRCPRGLFEAKAAPPDDRGSGARAPRDARDHERRGFRGHCRVAGSRVV